MTHPHTDGDREHPAFQRRTLLRGVALTGMIGASAPFIAACGGDGSADAESGSGSGSGSEAESGGGSEGMSSELGAASAVPVGGGMVFKEQKVVVTQPSQGDFKAFTAVCTHQGCTVAEVAGGTINCPCHGSKFKVEDGSVANGPAEQPLEEKQITVEGGTITLA